MNSFERYSAVIRGEPVDFLPRLPILMQYAAEYIGSNYGEFASDYRVLVEANLRCAEDFGMDQLSVISDPYRETQGFGAEIEFVRDGVPRCTRPPLAATKDLRRLPRPNPMEAERMRDRVDAVRSLRDRTGGSQSIMGWIEGPAAEAADLRGLSELMIDLIDDPGFCEDLMDLCVEVGIEFARAQIDAGADTVGIGDAVASQVSPAVYRQLILPREKALVKAIQSMGAWVRLHICGDITHLLPGIASLGVDLLDLDHMVDMAAVRGAIGSRVVLTGNIDPVKVLQGNPRAIRSGIAEAYRSVGDPYMVGAGCEIPSGTPAANLRALCEEIPTS